MSTIFVTDRPYHSCPRPPSVAQTFPPHGAGEHHFARIDAGIGAGGAAHGSHGRWGMTITAEEVMTKDAVSVDETATLGEALETLSELQVRHLPVVRDGEVVGMISDRDLRDVDLKTVQDFAGLESALARLGRPVSSLMTGSVLSVGPEAEIGEVIDLMLEERVGAVPVVDDDSGDLVGIVSYVDVLRALRGEVAEH